MKTVRTIRDEILRLKVMSEDARLPAAAATQAYEAYHALRWVLNDLVERPSRLIALAYKP